MRHFGVGGVGTKNPGNNRYTDLYLFWTEGNLRKTARDPRGMIWQVVVLKASPAGHVQFPAVLVIRASCGGGGWKKECMKLGGGGLREEKPLRLEKHILPSPCFYKSHLAGGADGGSVKGVRTGVAGFITGYVVSEEKNICLNIINWKINKGGGGSKENDTKPHEGWLRRWCSWGPRHQDTCTLRPCLSYARPGE